MRTLTLQQRILSTARDLEVVHIVELKLYRDRTGDVLEQRLRFSTVALTGFTDAEDSVTQECIALLVGVPKVPEQAMYHFPALEELSTNSLRATMSFDLVNAAPWGNGQRLSAYLEGQNVEFCDVKYMKLHLPLGSMNANPNTPIDVSGFALGSEIVLFRGVVEAPEYGEEVLSFQAATRRIESKALTLQDPAFLSTARGQRIPQPYGEAVIVRCPRILEPLGALLTERINNASVTGDFDVKSDLQLPTSGTYMVSLDGETGITCTGIAHGPNVIRITTRGTNASSHEENTFAIIEGVDATVDPTWVVAAFEIKEVTDVLMGTSLDDVVFPLEPADFTVVNPDKDTIPGESIVTVSMTTDTLLGLFPDRPLTVAMFALVDGRVVPFDFETAYDFDDDANWNDSPVGVHSSENPGRHFQSVKTPWDENAANTENAGVWGTQNCTVTTVTSPRLFGAFSLQALRNDAGSKIYGIDNATVSIPFPDVTAPGPLFICNIRLNHSGGLGDVVSVAVLIGTSAINNDVYGFDDALFANNVWKTIVCERGRRTGVNGVGMTGATITYIKVFVSNGQAGHKFFLDKIQAVDLSDMVMQKNDLLDLDMDSANDLYKVFAKALQPQWIDTLEMSISDETLTGTTGHTDFHQIGLTGLTSAWQEYRETATTGGTPDATFVESIRVEVTLKGTDIYQQVVGHNNQRWEAGASIDSLAKAVNPGTPYVGGVPGSAIDHPADVIRLHLQENGGLTESQIDLDGLADLLTSIGAARKWSLDLRTIGLTWEEILLGLAWEAGCNVVRAELVDQSLFRVLVGNGSVGSFGFGEPVFAVTEGDYRGQTIYPRHGSTVFTEMLMLYKLQSSLDQVDDTAFEGVAQSSLRQNDVSAFLSTDFFTDAEERWGRLIKPGPIYSRAIHDDATAQERLAREATYRAQEGVMVHLGLESWVGVIAELGDIITVEDRLSDTTRKMRILRLSQSGLGTPMFGIEVD